MRILRSSARRLCLAPSFLLGLLLPPGPLRLRPLSGQNAPLSRQILLSERRLLNSGRISKEVEGKVVSGCRRGSFRISDFSFEQQPLLPNTPHPNSS